MKVLVTGASGFIGWHACKSLDDMGFTACPLVRAGSDVSALTPWAAETRTADLRDEAALRAAVRGVDAVIHLGGLTRARSLETFREVNAEGVARLVEACRSEVPGLDRFVLVSSIAAAGPGTPEAPRREADPCEPVTPYGLSKLEGERVLRDAAADMPWTIVRPPIVYGPRERDMLAIFRLCRRGVVPVVGFRDKHYSLVYGPDLARHLVELLTVPDAVGRTLFVAEDQHYSYRDLVSTIGRGVGRVPPLPRVPHLVPRLIALMGSCAQRFTRRPPLLTLAKLPEVLAPGWVCSTESARSLLPTVGPTGLEQGARETAAWYEEHGWL